MINAKKFLLDYQKFLTINFSSPGKAFDQHSFLTKNLYHTFLQNIKNSVLARANLVEQDYDIFVTVFSPVELKIRWSFEKDPIVVDLFKRSSFKLLFFDQPIFVENPFFALLFVIVPKVLVPKMNPVLWGGEMVESVSKKAFSVKKDLHKFFVGTAFVAQVYFLEKYLRENNA